MNTRTALVCYRHVVTVCGVRLGSTGERKARVGKLAADDRGWNWLVGSLEIAALQRSKVFVTIHTATLELPETRQLRNSYV